jgi:AAHS family 4-hydroxybenzoate transporter-like MFS transporter
VASTTISRQQTIDIEAAIDARRFGWFDVNLLFWSFLVMVADGYDLAGLASAAPALATAWHLLPKAFAPALSASLFGILLGAPLFGSLGDRFGRKPAIIIGSVLYGLMTLAMSWATNLDQIVLLRFVTGIGLGGLMPNIIALNAELAPKSLRATLVVLAFTGITTGAGLPGAVQAWLIPSHGWPIVFWIGGLVPLGVACCLPFALPESVAHLALRPDRRAKLFSTLRQLRPDLTIAEDMRFSTASNPQTHRSTIRQLFTGRLLWITPLIWACFATALMANFFLNSWLPLILQGNGLRAREIGVATLCYHYAGTAGGLLVSLVLGRFGFAVLAVLFLLGALATAAIGSPGMSYTGLVTTVMLSGFCIVGAQFCNNAASGLIYPTQVRSTGVGWALGVGRFGSIFGPIVGGLLIGRVPLQQLFFLAAAPITAGLLASLALTGLWYQHTRTTRLLAP